VTCRGGDALELKERREGEGDGEGDDCGHKESTTCDRKNFKLAAAAWTELNGDQQF
jgi:hypothetical protein